MKASFVLDMLREGNFETLKAVAEDEVYKESLKKNGGAKNRYAAMKRFFRFVGDKRACMQSPAVGITVKGDVYNSFCDGHCFALTEESIGEITPYSVAEHGDYFNMEKMVDLYSYKMKVLVDVRAVLAKSKTQGYKFLKSEEKEGKYFFQFEEGIFKTYLVDKVFSIIDDGEEAEVYYNGAKAIMYIVTSIGIAAILPVNMKAENKERAEAENRIVKMI